MEKFRSSTKGKMRVRTDDKRGVDVDRRGEGSGSGRRGTTHVPSTLSDLLDPFGPTWSLNQVLNQMDQLRDNPLAASARVPPLGRRDWDAREDVNAFYLRIDMPGLDKEHVCVSAEQGTLVIKGEGEEEEDDEDEDESPRRYNTRIDIPTRCFKMDQIRTEMKNGVLKVVVPKVREEEYGIFGDFFINYKKPWNMLFRIKQQRGESLRDYIHRFNKEMLEVSDFSQTFAVVVLMAGLCRSRFRFSLCKKQPKDLADLFARAEKYINAEEMERQIDKRQGQI